MAGVHPITIARLRLVAQAIHRPTPRSPLDTVRQMTAMQGQDLPGALWAIGLRTAGSTEADIRRAFDRGEIVRGWPMRGTLHVTTPDDLRLILPLSRHRLETSFATRHRELGIERADIAVAADVAATALDGNPMARKDLLAVVEAAGQSTLGQRGAHLIGALAHSGLICLGPFAGRDQAFVLFDDWAPQTRHPPDREDAIAEVALRYFLSHGPATVADFAWWANLTLTDVRSAIPRVADELAVLSVGSTSYYAAPEIVDLAGTVRASRAIHLLPGFDENLLGYTDRSPALAPAYAPLIVPGNNGMFKATLVVGGRVSGTWTRSERTSTVGLTVTPFTEFAAADRPALDRAVARYAQFKGKEGAATVTAAFETTGRL